MPQGFTSLQQLGILLHNGLLTTVTETIRVRDIQRLELIEELTPFGKLTVLTWFPTDRIALVAHGTFGSAVLCETELTRFVLATEKRDNICETYLAAKETLEALLMDE
jgi:hypothetical protein